MAKKSKRMKAARKVLNSAVLLAPAALAAATAFMNTSVAKEHGLTTDGSGDRKSRKGSKK